MMKSILAAIILCAGALSASAQLSNAGTTVFDILNITFGAREIALAGGSVALPNDLDGYLSNPSANAWNQQICSSVGVRNLELDLWGALGVVGMPITNTGVWSLGFTSVSYGSVDEVLDINGAFPTGRKWRSDAVAGTLSWAKVLLPDLGIGASLKGIYHYIGTDGERYSADGLAVDLGAQYRLLGTRLTLGAALRNWGRVRHGYSAIWDESPLPLSFAAGVSYVPLPIPTLRLNGDFVKTRGEYPDFRPGIELAIFRRLLFARVGYQFSSRDIEAAAQALGGEPDPVYQKSRWNTVCLGIGVCTRPRNFDVNADAAVEFHTDAAPSVAITLHLGH